MRTTCGKSLALQWGFLSELAELPSRGFQASGLLATLSLNPRRGGAAAFPMPGPFKLESTEQGWTEDQGVQLPPAHPLAPVQLPSLAEPPFLHLQNEDNPASLGLVHQSVCAQPHESNPNLPPRTPNKVGRRQSKERRSGLVGGALGMGTRRALALCLELDFRTEFQQGVEGGFQPRALRVNAGRPRGLGHFPKAVPCSQPGPPVPSLFSFLGPCIPIRCLQVGSLPRARPSWEQQPFWILLC